MGFFRALIQATPHSMPGGFYGSSWQAAIEEGVGYLTNIRFDNNIKSLNILNNIANDYDYTDPKHPKNPVYGTSSNGTNPLNTVTGINISNYDKLYLNSNCSNMFYTCRNCTDWSGLSLCNWTYVVNCKYMFGSCYNFNQPVTIGPNVTDCNYMFGFCQNFNQPITFGQKVTNCLNMFRSCSKFNQPVTIGQNVTDCNMMFTGCGNFNQLVTFGQKVTNCDYMFGSCYNFNQPVTIGPNVTRCSGMFSSDFNFNQPVTIGPNVTRCNYMFNWCYNFNQPVTIGQNVVNCNHMFNRCLKFNQPIIIPESVVDCGWMFDVNQGTSWGLANNIIPVPDVYFKGRSFRNIRTAAMFGRSARINSVEQHNNTRGIRVNVHYNVAIENQMLANGVSSFTGTDITWTAMSDGNGYYNTSANIYLYNNYEG